MRTRFAIALLIACCFTAFGQTSKPALDHSVYDDWKSFGRVEIPGDGNALVYEVAPQVGSKQLIYRDLTAAKEISLKGYEHMGMSSDGRFALVCNAEGCYEILNVLTGSSTPLATGGKAGNVLFQGNKVYYVLTSDAQTSVCCYGFDAGNNTLATFPANVNVSRLLNEGRFVSFIAEIDGIKTLYLHDGRHCREIISDNDPRVPDNMTLAPSWQIFRSDSTKIYISLKKRPKPSSETPNVKIWSWTDDYLMPELEKKQATWDNKTYACRLDISGEGPLTVLETENSPIVEIGRTNARRYVFGGTDQRYRQRQQWELEVTADYYLIDLQTGEREMVMEEATIKYDGTSPDGRYVCYLDCPTSLWHLYDIDTREDKVLTADSDGIFCDDENDTPSAPFGYNFAKWSSDSKMVYLQDKYDVWAYDILKGELHRLTNGRVDEITFRWRTDVRSSAEPQYIEAGKDVYLSVFDHVTKENGLAVLHQNGKVDMLFKGPYSVGQVAISHQRKGLRHIVQKGNFETGYNLYCIDSKGVETQITDMNPQQRDYNWGTAFLLQWNVPDGSIAEGIVFKPEDFDPARKYPVMVYFYQLNSNDLYAVREPGPSFAKVNVPYFVSNGYVVFIPDVRYKIGHPGQSAVDYVLSGCDKLCEYPWVDAEHIGIQGQSWGGYQTAYIVTRTDRFAAACAGAPVSNMTSAYGGIRWGTGKSRQYLYEQSQSRIGKTLWEAPELYVENSPLFRVPDINTPLLIMHADNDEAVPWTQSLEFFSALKRCGKPAWMLQYVGESHDLSKRNNAKDLSIRFSEFFGYYLKGEPKPDWMK